VVLLDSVVRLLPGALGDEASAEEESFSDGLLEYPQYTRPAEFRGWRVPEVVLSGNHGAIRAWRMQMSVEETRKRRPDLLSGSCAHGGKP
jgi:tRNA (guanine37-N1)-methyltransferase